MHNEKNNFINNIIGSFSSYTDEINLLMIPDDPDAVKLVWM